MSPANIELIGLLSLATEQDVTYVAANITWHDAQSEDNSAFLVKQDGQLVVVGGRLGRDHTLRDVPNHVVRDQIMRWITDHIPADQRHRVAGKVFWDLDDLEIKAYFSALESLRKAREALLDRLMGRSEVPNQLKDQLVRSKRSHPHKDQAPRSKISRQRKNLFELDTAIAKIDCDVPMTPYSWSFGWRDYSRVRRITMSCIKPHCRPTADERYIALDGNIRHDCDQIRAKIARLVRYSDWTVEHFRKTLRVTRKELLAFVQKKGQWEGAKLKVFHQAWEFFQIRKLAGASLLGELETFDEPEPESETVSVGSELEPDMLEVTPDFSSPEPRKRKRTALADVPTNVAASKSPCRRARLEASRAVARSISPPPIKQRKQSRLQSDDQSRR